LTQDAAASPELHLVYVKQLTDRRMIGTSLWDLSRLRLGHQQYFSQCDCFVREARDFRHGNQESSVSTHL